MNENTINIIYEVFNKIQKWIDEKAIRIKNHMKEKIKRIVDINGVI